jgi:hypothetical protein
MKDENTYIFSPVPFYIPFYFLRWQDLSRRTLSSIFGIPSLKSSIYLNASPTRLAKREENSRQNKVKRWIW